MSAPRPGRFTPSKEPVPTVQEVGWAPGQVWTVEENLVTTGIRSPDRPVRSESLYRLSYPSPYVMYRCPLLSDFNETWIFFDRVLKNTQTSNFIKIRQVQNEVFHADGQTDMTKLTVAFRYFTNAPKEPQSITTLTSTTHNCTKFTRDISAA